MSEGGSIGNDTVVNNNELIARAGANGVTVDSGGRPMRGPTRVGNGDLRREDLGSIDGRFGDALAEPSDLADLFEKDDLAWLVTIDTDTS